MCRYAAIKESSCRRMKFWCINSGCPEGARNWHILIFCHAEHGKIEAPVPAGTEGEMLSRYHLWFAVSSRKRPHAVPTHGSAVTGAPGARLLGFGKTVGVPAPRCIQQASLSPFHRPGALLAGRSAYSSASMPYTWSILSDLWGIVNGK